MSNSRTTGMSFCWMHIWRALKYIVSPAVRSVNAIVHRGGGGVFSFKPFEGAKGTC